ncbi:hypothetical protein GS875_05865, partial [Rhodococcus hoagii]|nr:hypothetical protein [Prescottella equi]
GLADRVTSTGSDGGTAAAKASFELSVFNYAGREAAPAPRTLAPLASAARTTGRGHPTERGGSDVAFTDEQTSELREALSLPENATQDQIFEAALDRATAPAAPAASAAPALPDGVVAVEASVLEELRLDAQRGAQARAQQETEARAALVSAAIKDGRIAAARKDHWLTSLEADPEGAAETLASLAPGLVPVEELGHGVGAENNAEQDLDWFSTTSTKGA